MVQLSASTMESNRETFIKLLPVFIGKKLSGKELEAFEGILETTEEE